MQLFRASLYALATCGLLAAPSPADAEGKRRAYVFANFSYQSLDRLTGPQKDAIEIGKLLSEQGGFEVQVFPNLDKSQLSDRLDQIRNEVQKDDKVFLYYAGHGGSFENKDHIAPIDATLTCSPGEEGKEKKFTSNWGRWVVRTG